ncbi:MAG: thioredoxin [Christensenellales bacterium]|jgi:thioredoxin 1
MSITLQKDTFDATVLKSDKPVLVDFWASWCGPCRMVGPFVDQIAEEFEGKALVGKVNIDEEAELAQRYSVQTVPTLLVFKNGEIVDKIIGAVPKTKLADLLNKHL